jgi:glycosyltransferase involved in cell wall biosynthesis
MPVEDEAMSAQVTKHSRRAAVVSLHYSYAHASHMIALAKLLREIGYEVAFMLDEKYRSFADFPAIGQVISAREFYVNPGTQVFDLVFLCSVASRNHSIARVLHRHGITVLYVFHEPEPLWRWRNLQIEGWELTVRHSISAFFSIKTLRQSSGAIVHSSCAQALYERHYRKYNSNVRAMPLLFDDEVGDERIERTRRDKRYFGFVGTACKSHGFDAFVAFAKYAVCNGSDLQFLIATRVDLTSALAADKELARLVSEGRILMEHGRVFSNDEINRHYLECFCVWNAYLRSTQSGVVPRAFMAGTPALASRVGSFPEYIQPGVNGEFVDPGDDPAVVLEVVERIRRQSQSYVDACRRTFKETFYYRANLGRLAEIVEDAPNRGAR